MGMRLVLVAVLLLAGCATPSHATSGIEGTAMVGPTCPVQHDPPDPQCADRAYTGDLELVRDGSMVQRFTVAANGAFHIDAAPGTYTLRSPEDQMLPRCDAGPVTVKANAYAHLDVACDSGIR